MAKQRRKSKKRRERLQSPMKSGATGEVSASETHRGYIVSPWFDRIFFIYAPLFAAALPFAITLSDYLMEEQPLGVEPQPRITLLLGTFIYAHLALVFFRSHANPAIFRTHPIRFTAVPLALFASMWSSVWIAVCVSVLVTWWDVYHSGLQTFGLGRIYDARAGNDPRTGRRLDWGLNLLLYVGPILGGASLMAHVNDFHEFQEVGSIFFTSIPAYTESHARDLTHGMTLIGVGYLAYYLFAYARLARQGYRVSHQKVRLYAITGLVSIYAWGFNPFGHAFFVMNFFHAWQYFAIVWSTDKKNVQRVFGLTAVTGGRQLALALFVVLPLSFGYWGEAYAHQNAAVILWNTIAIMHFWYDGFIWSVRKRQV